MKRSVRESLALVLAGRMHRFNNVLQSAVGTAELAAVSAPPGTEIAELTEAAVRAARDLVIESRRLLEPVDLCWEPLSPTPLAEVVDAALGTALASAETVARVEGVDHPVLAAPGLLGQAFAEIVDNARAAMDDGGALRIVGHRRPVAEGEHALPAGDYVEIRFVDEGPGFTEEELPALFEPWPRADARVFGLGLAVARAVVRNHRGAVWAEAVPGAGTVVVLLPVA